jgi:hypothetical protein
MVYLTTLSFLRLYRRIVGWIVNNELQRKQHKSSDRVKPRKAIVSLAGFRAESWIWYLPSTKQECSFLMASLVERDITSVVICTRFYSVRLNLAKITASNFCTLLSRHWPNLTVDWSLRYKHQVINPLKASCCYVYQQILIENTTFCAQALCMPFMWFPQRSEIFSLPRINRLVL